MWFGTHSGGVSRYDGRTFVNFTSGDGLASSEGGVNAIHSDPAGVIWFGTSAGGISRYDARTLTNFSTKDGLAHN